MRNTLTFLLLPVVYMAFPPVIAQTDIAAVLADPSRPAADRGRDAGRMPGRVLAFFDSRCANLLRPSLRVLGARAQREHQRTGATVFTEAS